MHFSRWLSLRHSFVGRSGLLEWRGGLALGRVPNRAVFHHDDESVATRTRRVRHEHAYSGFFLSQLGQAALLSIVSALLVVIAVVPGEPLYRVSQPGKIRLGVGFRLAGLRTKEFLRRMSSGSV